MSTTWRSSPAWAPAEPHSGRLSKACPDRKTRLPVGGRRGGNPVTTTSEPAGLAQPRRQVQTQALWKRILRRPEAGALAGAILVFVFFWVMAPPFRQFPAFATVLYQASTIGIPAVPV